MFQGKWNRLEQVFDGPSRATCSTPHPYVVGVGGRTGSRGRLICDCVIRGEPKAQPRPRTTPVPNSNRHRIYTPPSADNWKSEVRAVVQHHVGELSEYVTAPVWVGMEFAMPRPKAHWRTGKHQGKLKPKAPFLHTKKPDVDNLVKAVLDSLGEFRGLLPLVWADDAQVVRLDAWKHYEMTRGRVGMRLTIIELEVTDEDDTG